ncbi:MAG: IS30 family transposase [bacterium]
MRNSFKQLTSEEREQIAVLSSHNFSKRKIAKELGRSPSTISREFKKDTSVIVKNRYFAVSTIENIRKNKLNTRRTRKTDEPKVKEYIIEKLKLGWSPEIISVTMLEDIAIKVGKDAIYDFIYKGNSHLSKYLTRKHLGRKPQSRRKGKRTLIPNRIDIDFRPIEANKREELGHFEADTVVSCRGSKSALLVIADRATRMIKIKKLAQKTAEQASNAIVYALNKNNIIKIAKTITYDNGCEFCWHEKVNENLKVKSFFCKPYHAWEKGTIENLNTLIRRFFPKGTDFDKISDEQVQYVEDWINNRPMKVLGYKTPNQKFYKLQQVSICVAS